MTATPLSVRRRGADNRAGDSVAMFVQNPRFRKLSLASQKRRTSLISSSLTFVGQQDQFITPRLDFQQISQSWRMTRRYVPEGNLPWTNKTAKDPFFCFISRERGSLSSHTTRDSPLKRPRTIGFTIRERDDADEASDGNYLGQRTIAFRKGRLLIIACLHLGGLARWGQSRLFRTKTLACCAMRYRLLMLLGLAPPD